MSEKNRFKFRVWDNNFKKYRNGLAIQNSHVCTYDDNACILEQCTGLTDKNGKLIYEGDIFKATVINSFPGDKCLNQTIIGKVSYYTKECAFAFSAYKPINLFEIEIISNIHEDKGLIQCEKNS